VHAPNYRDLWNAVRSHLGQVLKSRSELCPGAHYGSSSRARTEVAFKRRRRCTTTAVP
jgi:hypothetical protein